MTLMQGSIKFIQGQEYSTCLYVRQPRSDNANILFTSSSSSDKFQVDQVPNIWY